jgi:hypothetical protein
MKLLSETKSNKISTSYGCKVSVEIERDAETDTATVNVHAPLYIKKFWTMPHCYKASQFTDLQIINDSDFKRVMFSHFPSDD